nr:MAG TPA: hypothetical protein [Caudoviricetes sp.]
MSVDNLCYRQPSHRLCQDFQFPDISGQFEGRNSDFAQGAFKVISHRTQLQAGSSYDTTRFEMKLSYGKSIYTSIDKPQVDSFQLLIIVKT